MLRYLFLCVAISGALASPLNDRKLRIQNLKGNEVANEVCYDGYGCFSSEAPWTSALRPLVALPSRPEEIGTRHLLYTRKTKDEAEELIPGKEAMLKFSQFDGDRRTVFIVHGWTDSGDVQWVNDTKNNLLEKEDLNVLVIDWAPGARMNYLKAVGNARLIGAQIAIFIDFLMEFTPLTTNRIHLIGHSIGAHICGYVGSRIPGIERLTALDPVQPYFEGTDRMVRLDEGDAIFVEGIHTNGNAGLALGLGMSSSVGQLDIFVNGGDSQPGCKDKLGTIVGSLIELIEFDFTGAISTFACSHQRAAEYWAESLKSECPYVAYNCADYKKFEKGECYQTCQASGCTVIGLENEIFKQTAPKGKYFLHTDEAASFCLQAAHLESTVSAGQEKIDHGRITVQLRRQDGVKTEAFILAEGEILPGASLSAFAEVPSAFLPSVSEKVQVIFHYTRTGLTPIFDPKTLVLGTLRINFLDKTLGIQTKTISGVTLDAGIDLVISE